MQQPLPIEIEALDLELALEGEQLALRREAPVEAIGRQRGIRSEQVLALELLPIQLLLLQPLIELKLLDSACIGWAHTVLARGEALLKAEIERTLLLLDLKMTPRCGKIGGDRAARYR